MESNRVENLFEQALRQPPAARQSFLRSTCGDDQALLAELMSLLSSHDQADSFMETPAIAGGETKRINLSEHVGRRIGRYQLGGILGAGGMGAVFEGEQQTPRRKVAVKLMHTNIFDPSARRRFDYEAEVLAHLQHPGIAQIYEAGIHDENGSAIPYFAMEFVPDALTVVDFASKRNLPLRDRLSMFADVCDAVHHGHQKGVIHRDLKPANILVTPSREPKVIDFGVARATDSDLAITTLRTQSGQLVGTLQYMSPEQCGGNPDDIDTRTDVYSLGVILFELLTGERPYEIAGTSIAQAAQIIREKEPTRISTLNRSLRGDVETITRKALEKEKQRRYASAAELAADVRRYLGNEPISAHAPSAIYQLRKLVARHKAPVALFGVILALIVGGAVVVMYQSGVVAEERDNVARERDKVQRINDFLRSMLSAADPTKSGPDVPVREVLDVAAQRVESELGDDPIIEATMRDTIGQTYLQLGIYEPAETHLVRALELRREYLGPIHPSTLNSTANVAALRYDQGRLAESVELSREAIRIQEQLLGPTHLDTLRSKIQLVSTLWRLGAADEAEALCAEALQQSSEVLGDHDDTTLIAENTLAILTAERGDYESSEQIFAHVVQVNRDAKGDDHPNTLTALNNLSQLYTRMGRFAEAETLMRETLEGRRSALGDEHPNTLTSMNNLGSFLREHGQFAEAEPLLAECLTIRRRVLGDENPNTLSTMHNLAGLYRALNRLDESEALYRETLDLRTQVMGAEHPQTLRTMSGLAAVLHERGESQQAVELASEAVDTLNRTRGPDHPDTMWESAVYASLLMELDRSDEAKPLLTETLEHARSALPPDHWQTVEYAGRLGDCLRRLGEFDDAETLLLESHAGLLAAFGEAHARTVAAIQRLVQLYESWEKPDVANIWRGRLSGTGADDIPENE